MSRQKNKIYEFGAFRLNVCERQLLRDGHPVKLRPKVFDTLCFLVENHGHLVGKKELLRRLWPDSAVEENNLAHNVAILRKALGEAATGQKYIETVPLCGYRFVANVRELEAEAAGGPDQTVPAPESCVPETEEQEEVARATRPVLPRPDLRSRRVVLATLALGVGTAIGVSVHTRKAPAASPETTDSVAVLPFVSLSADAAVEHFSDGLTAEVTARLAAVPGLRVPARTLMFQFKNKGADIKRVGQAVNAKALLEGSVRSQGNRFLITANLIDSRDGEHLWSRTYDRTTSDVLGLQREIAAQIAEAIREQVVGKGRGGPPGK